MTNKELYKSSDCIGINDISLKDRIVVLSDEYVGSFKPEYVDKKNQIVRATGGFGCESYAIGKAVYITFLSDGEVARVDRYNVMGFATDEMIKECGFEIK